MIHPDIPSAQQALGKATKWLTISGLWVAFGIFGEIMVDGVERWNDRHNSSETNSEWFRARQFVWSVIFGALVLIGVVGEVKFTSDVDDSSSEIQTMTVTATQDAATTGKNALTDAESATAQAKSASQEAQSASSDAKQAAKTATGAARGAEAALDDSKNAQARATAASENAQKILEDLRPRRLGTVHEANGKSSVDALIPFKGTPLVVEAIQDYEPQRAATSIKNVMKDLGWAVPDKIEALPADEVGPDGVQCYPSLPDFPPPREEYDKLLKAAQVLCEYLKGEQWDARWQRYGPDHLGTAAVFVDVFAKPNSLYFTSTLPKAGPVLPTWLRVLGPEPEEYRKLSNHQIADKMFEEADAITNDARAVLIKIEEARGKDDFTQIEDQLLVAFAAHFDQCCTDKIVQLRLEAYRRLQTATEDAEEDAAWEEVLRQLDRSSMGSFFSYRLEPMDVDLYAKHLRLLAQRVEDIGKTPNNHSN